MRRLSRRHLAQTLCATALRLAPAHRASLARAMMAELDHVSDKEALGFAAGCLSSAARWWLISTQGITQSTRFAISAGATALATTGLIISLRLRTDGMETAPVALALIAAFYFGAAFMAWRGGLKAVAAYAATGLALNTLAWLFQMPSPTGAPTDQAIVRALMVESYGLLSGLGGIALGAHWLAQRLKTPN